MAKHVEKEHWEAGNPTAKLVVKGLSLALVLKGSQAKRFVLVRLLALKVGIDYNDIL
jgi:hypothetical protein